MSNTAGTITVVATLLAVFGGWSFWLKAYLDARFGAIEVRLGQIETRLDRIEAILGDHGGRIARLEAKSG